jgi:hypothetical protein
LEIKEEPKEENKEGAEDDDWDDCELDEDDLDSNKEEEAEIGVESVSF